MLKKRLIGVVTIKQGWAVQSIGYQRYLPLGKPECIVENLSRWGADEIIVQVIDRYEQGPDYQLLNKFARLGLSTPLVYGGGIATVEQAGLVIQSGADRICFDTILHDNPKLAYDLAELLGGQALIGVLPLAFQQQQLMWLDYRTRQSAILSDELKLLLERKVLSEIMLVDWKHEGYPAAFDTRLIASMSDIGLPLIPFGGISEAEQVLTLLQHGSVPAVAIGNFLNYQEHAIQKFKSALTDMPVRTPLYESTYYD